MCGGICGDFVVAQGALHIMMDVMRPPNDLFNTARDVNAVHVLVEVISMQFQVKGRGVYVTYMHICVIRA